MVNALAGVGYIFTSHQVRARILRPAVERAFRSLLNAGESCLILQNRDDRAMLVEKGVVDERRIRLIRGSGVDTDEFFPQPEPRGVPVVMLASRMLWDKGVGEFVAAAKELRSRGLAARFVLVGDADIQNPMTVRKDQLQAWHGAGLLEWWQWRNDMPAVLSQAHIICLLSYREGLPKVLLEAASCSRAIVTADVPGCREIVRQRENGLLVPVRSTAEPADALELLIERPQLRQEMGARGREIVLQEFTVDRVVSETVALYGELLGR